MGSEDSSISYYERIFGDRRGCKQSEASLRDQTFLYFEGEGLLISSIIDNGPE